MLKRLLSTSSSFTMSSRPSVTKLVQTSMQKLYPLALADRSWDNVGLLLEPPYPARQTAMPKVLLTIDLTTAVSEEALEETSGVETIVTYHPVIFRGLKALTLDDPQQASLLKLCAKGIGVYSPHTSVDGAVGGVNDWLASVVKDGKEANVSTIVPVQTEGHEAGGYGRVVTLQKEIPITTLVERIKAGLNLKYVQLARPLVERDISSVALCAGSGAGVFKSLLQDVDVLFTGELSHHEVLAAVAKGQYVILCGHTNTERGFLKILQSSLQKDLNAKAGQNPINVIISQNDHDPIETI